MQLVFPLFRQRARSAFLRKLPLRVHQRGMYDSLFPLVQARTIFRRDSFFSFFSPACFFRLQQRRFRAFGITVPFFFSYISKRVDGGRFLLLPPSVPFLRSLQLRRELFFFLPLKMEV